MLKTNTNRRRIKLKKKYSTQKCEIGQSQTADTKKIVQKLKFYAFNLELEFISKKQSFLLQTESSFYF